MLETYIVTFIWLDFFFFFFFTQLLFSFTFLNFILIYFTILYFMMRTILLLYSTLLYLIILIFALLFFTLLYFTLLYYTLLYFTGKKTIAKLTWWPQQGRKNNTESYISTGLHCQCNLSLPFRCSSPVICAWRSICINNNFPNALLSLNVSKWTRGKKKMN